MAAAGTPDPVEAEVAAAVVLVVVAEVEVAAAEVLEVEAAEVAPTSGIVTTPSITITMVPDRGAGGARMRVEIVVMIVEMTVETVEMTVGTVVMTVEMIEMVGSLAGAKEEGDPLTDPAEPTERTPRLLPRYIYSCNLTTS